MQQSSYQKNHNFNFELTGRLCCRWNFFLNWEFFFGRPSSFRHSSILPCNSSLALDNEFKVPHNCQRKLSHIQRNLCICGDGVFGVLCKPDHGETRKITESVEKWQEYKKNGKNNFGNWFSMCQKLYHNNWFLGVLVRVKTYFCQNW